MTSTLDIGVAGCGRIARLVHLDALARLPDVRVVALAEPDPECLAEAARRLPGAALFPDYMPLVRDPRIEALLICLPPRTTAFVTPAAYTSFLSVNLRGREPQGIVAPGAEYDVLLDRIEDDLRRLVDADTGDPEFFRRSSHSAHGFFASCGPAIRRQGALEEIDVLNLAPTLLAALGERKPVRMSGRVLTELLVE